MRTLAGMRTEDQEKFSQTAVDFGWWILVRATNPASLPYIGRSGYCPKPPTCKAKTAEAGAFAGLVVNPEVVRDAFPDAKKLSKARKIWTQFYVGGKTPPGYSIDAAGAHAGCVRFEQQLIHGDYDLFDVVNPRLPTHWIALATSNSTAAEDMISWHQMQVKPILNSRLGISMIQHGVQAAFGTFEDEWVLLFGPHGERECLSKSDLEEFYRTHFSGRVTLDLYNKTKSGT